MSDTLPPTVEDEAHLEELLARPSPADVAFARTLTDDVLVLGAGGKMGPSLARRARRAGAAAAARYRVLAAERGHPCLLFRLFYAVDLRYGTIVDVARHVWAGEPVDLEVGRVNAIWQGDASSYALRSLALCASPAQPLVVTGPDPLSVRDVAQRFAARFRRPVRFTGAEGPLALLGNPAACLSRLGPPEVSLDRLVGLTAGWGEHGGSNLGKPTKFARIDGRI